MRSPETIEAELMHFVETNPSIRLFAMEGSRMNPEIEVDAFQDFDVTFFVLSVEDFIEDESWLDYFGPRLILQKPEAMTLYPAEEEGFSYLMLFEDGNKIDLTLMPVEKLQSYIDNEPLATIIVDKNQIINDPVKADPTVFHIQRPDAASFDDCCNEFWWVITYVSKGLLRHETLFAMDHLNQIVRKELFRMLTWEVGVKTDFSVSIGKNYKFLSKYLSENEWEQIMQTFSLSNEEAIWKALFSITQLFAEATERVANLLDFDIPDYEAKIKPYLEKQYKLFHEN